MAYFRKNMSGVHTWTGLVLGWLMLWMFLTGSLGYFDTEIDRWMQPELPAPPSHYDEAQAVRTAQAYLSRTAPDASRWVIFLPIDRNEPYLRVFWAGKDGTGRPVSNSARLSLDTGEPLSTRETGGGQLLYKMHWRLHYMPRVLAEFITGSAAMLMLIALVTGIIIHKNIFRDLFTFRPKKGRRSWLDLHNLVAVSSLPFQLMITYSGLVFVMFTYMPLIFLAFYGVDAQGRRDFIADISTSEIVAPANQSATITDLGSFITQHKAEWSETPLRNLDIRFPGDANASVTLKSNNAVSPLRASDEWMFSAVNGDLLSKHAASQTSVQTSHDILLGLHEGLFAPLALRWLYFLSGILGCLMIATGMIMWENKRRQQGKTSTFGLKLITTLNIASIAGMPLCIGAYFVANRLLPTSMVARADWEVHIMFITWLVCLLHAALRPRRRAWTEQFTGAGVAFLILPLLSSWTTERNVWSAIGQGDWTILGVESAFIVTGILFLIIAVTLHKRLQRNAAHSVVRGATA